MISSDRYLDLARLAAAHRVKIAVPTDPLKIKHVPGRVSRFPDERFECELNRGALGGQVVQQGFQGDDRRDPFQPLVG
ncbi:MAG: hypothetical protein ACRDKG_01295 [Actinomycetota bacterium]